MDGNGAELTLDQRRQRMIESGLHAIQEVEQERDTCRREYDELQTMHRGLKAEHDALQMAYGRLQNDMATYRADRDEAVTKLARFEAVYDAVLAVMQKHRGGIQKDTAPTPTDKA
jgi:chromosome segregation ATPase